ncbi:hypothetical protein PFISCL1PPCAC_6294, partial [Pristionchus fissidentatus]
MAKNDSKISANVLDMKFMRRTKQRMEDKEKKKQESDLQKAYLAGESTVASDKNKGEVPSSSSDRFVFTKDLEFLEDLHFGRLSFKGSNPQVEKLMKYYTDKKNGIENESDDEKDVSDDEMAETMGGSLTRTIAGKFKTKGNKRDSSLIDESTGDAKNRKRSIDGGS